MSNPFKKVLIQTAKHRVTRHDLSNFHQTTGHFHAMNINYIQELMPGSKIEFNMNTFSRLCPMPSPTIGNVKIINRQFFVPFRVIYPNWNDYISQSDGRTVQGFPLVYGFDFSQHIFRHISSTDSNYKYLVEVPDPSTTRASYTYDVYDSTGNKYYRLNPRGRFFVKLVNQLGYNFDLVNNSDYTAHSDLIPGLRSASTKFSALPLYAVGKIFYDYFSLSAYQVSSYSRLISPGALSYSNMQLYLADFVDNLYCLNYQSDYFVSAFDNPNVPNQPLSASIQIDDPSQNVSVSYNPNGKDAAVVGAAPIFTQFMVNALKSVSNFLKRNQLVGYRAVDRYLAHFGIKLNNAIVNRSVYLGDNSVDVKFEDVMSLSSTDTAELGDYAGRGYSTQGDSDKIVFETDEFGYFISTSVIYPRIAYTEGSRKQNYRTSPLDFYNPDFDSLGNEVIHRSELVPISQSQNDAVFGFTPRYSSYKFKLDDITGDFSRRTSKLELDSWSLNRRFVDPDDPFRLPSLVHSPNFCQALDNDQYNRIFYTLDDFDKFRLLFNHFVTVYQPCKALYDTYDFDSDEGRDIALDANGTQF